MGNCLSNTEGQNNRQQNLKNKNPQTPPSNHIIAANNPKVILRPTLPKDIVLPDSNKTKWAKEIKVLPSESLQVKVPSDLLSWTHFEWVQQPRYNIAPSISGMSLHDMKQRSFQEKLVWFRAHLEKKRVHWSSGKSDYLQVDRQNLLMSSNSQFESINFYKEVKIVFLGEEETSDAGGLLREWISCCINQIFSPELKLLTHCDTQGTFYKFNFNEMVADLFIVASRILGVVIGKAIFERIPLQCFLNYTILRQLCGQPLQFNDLYNYDKDFYSNWGFLLNNQVATTLMQNFCVYDFDEEGNELVTPLKESGFEIMLNSSNKEQYVTLLFEHYCINSVSKCIDNLKYGLYKTIPQQLLSIFQPHELDMVMNGKQQIDPLDLKDNTVYSGYQIHQQIISWFWEYVMGMSQKQLAYLLHFVTGNSRVPIQGFKYLQSNRGEYQKFHIKKTQFDPINPYPKSYTCFNRLELPHYPSRELFNKYIIYVSCENKHFGLD